MNKSSIIQKKSTQCKIKLIILDGASSLTHGTGLKYYEGHRLYHSVIPPIKK